MRQKKERLLEIFYRLMMGSGVSVSELAAEYEVSTKSVSRDINEIKNFMADHMDLLADAQIRYSNVAKKYYMDLKQHLSTDELFAIVKVMIGCRALSKAKTVELISKLKLFTSRTDKDTINKLISNELYHYNEIKHDCKDVVENLWRLTNSIEKKKEITISYYKMNREYVERRIRPVAITFTDYYFYLIGYQKDANGSVDMEHWELRYYRVDRIVHMVEHRTRFTMDRQMTLDEGDLMSKMQYMFPGKSRRIKFEFTGPSVQAVLDKLPTARVVDEVDGASIIEAEVFGIGVNMFLLSQGSWIKPISPSEFVEEMKTEVEKMLELYR